MRTHKLSPPAPGDIWKGGAGPLSLRPALPRINQTAFETASKSFKSDATLKHSARVISPQQHRLNPSDPAIVLTSNPPFMSTSPPSWRSERLWLQSCSPRRNEYEPHAPPRALKQEMLQPLLTTNLTKNKVGSYAPSQTSCVPPWRRRFENDVSTKMMRIAPDNDTQGRWQPPESEVVDEFIRKPRLATYRMIRPPSS